MRASLCKQEITITGCTVYVNPYKDEEEAERKAAEEERKQVTQQGDSAGFTRSVVLMRSQGFGP